jgi:TolA-binding protein
MALLAEPSVYDIDRESLRQYYEEDISVEEERGSGSPQPAFTSPPQPTLTSLHRQLQRQNERIDGLTTLVEGLSAQLFELQQQRGGIAPSSNPEDTELLRKLGEMIDKINSNYVSKEELRQILAGMDGKPVPPVAKTIPPSEQKVPLGGQANADLYKEGVRLFGQKQYDEAKRRFVITDEKGYKPAASNYYLGEIAYYTKQYEDAIFYFKKSAGLYDKASYIDVLLLHTGISLENTGKKDQAKLFYQNIIENYSGHNSAKIAKEKLKKL